MFGKNFFFKTSIHKKENAIRENLLNERTFLQCVEYSFSYYKWVELGSIEDHRCLYSIYKKKSYRFLLAGNAQSLKL